MVYTSSASRYVIKRWMFSGLLGPEENTASAPLPKKITNTDDSQPVFSTPVLAAAL